MEGYIIALIEFCFCMFRTVTSLKFRNLYPFPLWLVRIVGYSVCLSRRKSGVQVPYESFIIKNIIHNMIKLWVGSLAARAADCKSATKKHRWFEYIPAHLINKKRTLGVIPSVLFNRGTPHTPVPQGMK